MLLLLSWYVRLLVSHRAIDLYDHGIVTALELDLSVSKND
jgi:hypothetical protein